ncbi:probable transcription factor At4g00390 [Dioscorea cayenensis subsp. rotundata]|uniref:Probable transcription factor At4g00390 n=1 Tax=Dioscorea cayennensis subsp. rotundata TaxID=55577 RepID=A0AB40BRU3_DIOCR|nr:probable transcription factor At4g00390 [Dioscorea cayenensis subsp. rotundata]
MAPNPKRAPPKKPPPKPPSPSPSSSSSGDDSDPQPPRPTNNPIQSSSEDGQQSTPKPKHQPPAKNQQVGSDLSSGEDSDSDSPPPLEKSTSSRRPDPSIKPISSKPMAESPKSKKLSTPAPKSGQNPSNAPDAVEPESTITKRKLFERFWSEGDEIKILEGVAEYHRKKGTNPASVVDLDSLHEFMKSFLGSEFGKNQLGDKIRRLKKRFRTLHAKNNGNPKITKPHERAKYELSKKIWGKNKSLIDEAEDDGDEDEDAGNSSEHETVKQSSGKSRKRKDPVDNGVLNDGSNRTKEVDDCSYEYIREAFGQMKNDIFSDMFLEQGLKLAEPKKAKKLDQEFRELSMLEAKSNLEYISIVRDITSHALEALQKSG